MNFFGTLGWVQLWYNVFVDNCHNARPDPVIVQKMKMKKYLLILFFLFLHLASFHSANAYTEYESLKLKEQDIKKSLGKPKIERESLPLKKGLKKNKKAEEILDLAAKLMNQDIYVPGHPLPSHPGWLNPHTLIKLKEVVRNFPDTEAAVYAKLSLAMIIESRTYGNEPDYARELFSEIERMYPVTWLGIYAGYERIVQHISDDSPPKKIKAAVTDMQKYLSKLKKLDADHNRGKVLDFFKKFNRMYYESYKDSKFIQYGYGSVALGYCLLDDIGNAKKAYREIVEKFPGSRASRNAQRVLKGLEKGKCPLK